VFSSLLPLLISSHAAGAAPAIAFLESSTSKRLRRHAEESIQVSLMLRCAGEPNCLVSSWCNDTSTAGWCAQHVSSECPEPRCRLEANVDSESDIILNVTCGRQNNCTLSEWCDDPGYAVWCENEENGCPAPMCVWHESSRTGSHSRPVVQPPSLPPLPTPYPIPLSEPETMMMSLAMNTSLPPPDLPFPLPLG